MELAHLVITCFNRRNSLCSYCLGDLQIQHPHFNAAVSHRLCKFEKPYLSGGSAPRVSGGRVVGGGGGGAAQCSVVTG